MQRGHPLPRQRPHAAGTRTSAMERVCVACDCLYYCTEQASESKSASRSILATAHLCLQCIGWPHPRIRLHADSGSLVDLQVRHTGPGGFAALQTILLLLTRLQLRPHSAHQRGVEFRICATGRCDLHRHTIGRGLLPQAPNLAEEWRCRGMRDRRHWHYHQPSGLRGWTGRSAL